MKVLKTVLQFKYVLIFTILIILLSIFRVSNYKSNMDPSDKEFVFEITNIKYKANKTIFYLKGSEKVIGNLYENIGDFSIGDKVYIKGILYQPKENTIPNTFNYKEYLAKNNVFYLIEIEEIKLLSKTKNIFIKLKNKIIRNIEKRKNKDYLYTFILGNSNFLDESDYEKYKENGITHLFAVSGMHISFLTSFIFFVLSLLRVKEIRKYIFTFLILLFFAYISNFSNSVLRSIIFFLLVGINKIYRLNVCKETILLLTLSIVLFVNPSALYSYSLIFSFTIAFFLIYHSKELSYFKALLYSSFISFISSLPIVVNLNFEINILTLLNNLIFIPLVSLIIYPLCIFNLFFEFTDGILSFFLDLLTNLNNLVNIYKINIIFPKMNVLLIVFYYSFLLLYRFIKGKKMIALYFCLIIYIYYNKNFDNNSYVYFFDVNQGDSSLIISQDKNILIDTSGNFSSDYVLNNMIIFFKSIGLRKIDYLILTHGDYDHMGWSLNLVDKFKVEKVIFNCGGFNELEQELINALQKKKIPYYSCIKELNIGDNKSYFLNNKDYGNENDNSNVFYTKINNYKFLFMGDAGVEVEQDLIKKYNLKDIDVLKVGHHGSKTSSGEEFINEVNPKYGIISVGENNRYGHPSNEVLNNLENSKIYRTDKDGSIMFKIKNNKLKIEMCAP